MKNKQNQLRNGILAFVLLLFSLVLAANAYAAQDFIIENRTSALFVVNGTTGNIFMAPSFGLVGIGTANPYNTLTVVGSISASSINATSINATQRLIINNTLYVNGSRVGVGTSSPENTLHVLTVDSAGGIRLSGADNPRLRVIDTTNSAEANVQVTDTQILIGSATNHDVLFRTNNADKAALTAGGSFGIGTLSPYNTLTVVGSVGVSGSLNASSINTTGSAYFATSSGRVGIGATVPNATLFVQGNATIAGNLNVTGTAYIGSLNVSGVVFTGGNIDARNITADNIDLRENKSLYQPVYPSDDGLVLYLPFNSPNGTTQFDRSPYGNDGTQTNGPNCNATLGKYGAACRFDGADDYINVANDTSAYDAQRFTLEAWIRTSTNDYMAIVGNSLFGNTPNAFGYGMRIDGSSAQLFVRVGDSDGTQVDVTGTTSLNDNNWHHVAGTYDGNNVKIYVDGKQEGSTAFTGTISFRGDNIQVGRNTGSSNFFNGDIDEVRIYKRALAPEEIRTHYLRGSGFGAMGAITADRFRVVNTSGNVQLRLNQSTFSITNVSGNEGLLYVDRVNNAVGIRTTSPQSALEIWGTGGENTNPLTIRNSAATEDEILLVEVQNGAGRLILRDSSNNNNVDIRADTSETIFNDLGGAQNFRIESDTNDFMFKVDGTNNRIGIAGDSPAMTLDVRGNVTIKDNLTVDTDTLFVDSVNNRVGIGTTGPQNKLEVIGAATFAGGVNASSLNVTGFSITDDSLVTLSDGSKKKIKDIKAGEEVLTLDEKTSKLVPRKVNALLDHGIKPIYEMATESGRAINTTAEHPYLAKLYSKEECDKYSGNVWNKEPDEFNGEYCIRWVEVRDLNIAHSTISNQPSQTINNLPLNSLTSAKREDNADVNFSTVGGWIKNTTIPQNFFGGNIALFRKSESLESKTKDFSLASKANLPFLVPLAAYSAENPLDSRNSLISILMFSSSRNFGESDITFSADGLGGIFQGIPDHFLGEARITPNNTFHTFSSGDQFNDIANQNSSAFESGLSMADFAVRNNVFANFDSHKTYNDGEIFKGFEIAVPDYQTGAIKWERIASIKSLEPQHVYDLSIEGTRNFIANDIVAHNTYLATSSGNVGIGTTAPNYLLQVASGTDGRSVNLSNVLYVNGSTAGNVRGRVGIGTSPVQKLDVSEVAASTGGGPRVRVANLQNDAGIARFEILKAQSATNVDAWFMQVNYTPGFVGFQIGRRNDSKITGDTNDINSINSEGNERIFLSIDQQGNVGINTTSPQRAFQVKGGVNLSNVLYVEDNGNVGIGTTNPGQKLTVIGTVNVSQGRIITAGNSGDTTETGNGIIIDNTGYGGHAARYKVVVYNDVNQLDFRVNTAADGSFSTENTLMTIQQTGDVGIGATNPAHKLTVAGSVNITGNITLGNSLYLAENQSLYQPVYGTDDGLVLYLPFSENANNISNRTYDRSPYGNDGTLNKMNAGGAGNINNGSAWGNGKYGYAMEFDGREDYVSIGTNINQYLEFGNKDHSVEAWIYLRDSDETSKYILVEGNTEEDYRLGIVTSTSINTWQIACTETITTTRMTTNEWHHVAIVYDFSKTSNNASIYIDGFLDGQGDRVNPCGGLGQPLQIGGSGTAGRYFNGTIDEVRIYKRALAPEEIRTHYLRGSGFGAMGAITADKFRVINTSASRIFEVNQTGVTVVPTNSTTAFQVNARDGTNVLDVDTVNARVGIGTTSPTYKLHLADTSTTSLNVSDTLYVDGSNKRVGIGTAAPSGVFHTKGLVGSPATWYLDAFGAGNADFSVRQAEGTVAAPTATITDRNILRFLMYGHDGTDYQVSSEIRFAASGTIGNDRVPGRIIFWTAEDAASSSLVDRFEINTADMVFNQEAKDYDIRIEGTSDANLFFVDAGNNRIGIGTAAPYNTLTVVGSISANSINATSINATQRLIINNTLYVNGSRVGVGTAEPTTKLHVQVSDASGLTPGLFIEEVANTDGGIKIDPNTDAAGGSLWFAGNVDTVTDGVPSRIDSQHSNRYPGVFGYFASSVAADSKFYFLTANGVGDDQTLTERMSIIQTGNVGINTTTPSDTLTVNGTMNIRPLGTSALFVASSGNVGIGTTTPDTKLKVSGDANVTGTVWALGTNLSALGSSAAGWTDDGSAVRLTTATDNVGIGTTSPGAKLEVVGNVSINGSLSLLGENASLYQPVYPSDDGLVLYLPFNAPNGTTQYDRSPYGNDGALQGGINCNGSLGKYGAACKFNNDTLDEIFVATSNSLQLGGNATVTVEAWVKPSPQANTQLKAIVTKGDGSQGEYNLMWDQTNDQKFIFGWDNIIAATSANTYNDNEWHHVVGVREGTADSWTGKIYVNGKLDGTGTSATNPNGFTNDVVIGGFDGVDTNNFNGTIDEVRIYKRALAAEEIRTHYLRGSGFGAMGAITADKFRVVNTSGSRTLELNTTSFDVMATSGASALHINRSSGNVGIGTDAIMVFPATSGDSGLTIRALNGNRVAALELISQGGGGGAGNPDARVVFAHTNSGAKALADIIVYSDDADSDGIMQFRVATAGTLGNVMTLLDSGNVGIGTTTPNAKLEVNTSSGTVGIATNGSVGIGTTNPSSGWGASKILHIESASGNGPGITLKNRGETDWQLIAASAAAEASDFGIMYGGNTYLSIDNTSGNVGIGTITPTDLLTIKSDSAQLRLETGTDATNYYTMLHSDYNSNHPFNLSVANNGALLEYIGVYADGGINNRLVLNPNGTGNVGIGATNPSRKLTVAGTVNISGGLAVGGGVMPTENDALYPIRMTNARYIEWLVSGGAEGSQGAYVGVSGTNAFIFYDSDDQQAEIRKDAQALDDDGWGTGAVDYAEFMEKLDHSEDIKVYEVVAVKSGKITKNTKGSSMIMVTSTDSGIRGGNPLIQGYSRENDPDWLAVAFIGQVPVLVDGKVAEGDYIIPSGNNDGKAIAVPPEKISSIQFSQVIGRAIESSDNPSYNTYNSTFDTSNKEDDSKIKLEVGKMQRRRGNTNIINVAVGVHNGLPQGVILDAFGNVNVSGRLNYGTLAANSPHFLETIGSPEPLCIKSAIGKYVGCMVDEGFEFKCKIDDRCSRKYLESRLAEEVEKLNREIGEKSPDENINNAQPNGTISNESAANSITGNMINEVSLNSDLSSILGKESSTTTQTTIEQNTSVIAENSSNVQTFNVSIDNSTNETVTQNNNSTNKTATDEKMTMTDTTHLYANQTATVSAGSTEYKKQKMEKLSRIRDDVKRKSITIKQAKEQLRYEELEYVDVDEIESEEDAIYTSQPTKGKEKQIIQAAQLDYMQKVNGSVIIRLG